MQPTSRVGTAFEGSNSPRGPSGASEPPDVFCGLASLIVEGRIPRNDGRGYGEGPHVPQTASKSLSSRHECCNENNVVSLKIYEIWYFGQKEIVVSSNTPKNKRIFLHMSTLRI